VNTANESFYRTFGLVPSQTENRPLFELAEGAWNIPALRALLADVLPRNHFFNDLEVTHHFGGVGERTMLLNGRRLESEAGEPLRILLSIEDVTERRRSRAALSASEVRYRRLFEAAKDGVIIVDPETRRITDVNPFMVQLLGYRRDEFLGKELFEIGLFRDEAAAQDAFTQLRDRREIRYDHLPLRAKNGDAHEVEVVANLYDEDGRPTIQCNVRDITERKRLEAAVQASETYFRELTQALPIGVWTSLPEGRVDFINRYWLEYTGQQLEYSATSPTAWLEAVHPDDRERLREASAASRVSGEGYVLEARIRHATTGAYRWFLKRSLPVRDATGAIQKRIGMCIDIDDLKTAEAILSNHAGDLSREVLARTGELRETIGELEAFSYSVSHDMRAPLRAMQGFAQLLLQNNEATLDAPSIDRLRRISASAARLDALIGDVLTYSRLLRSEIVLEPVDLDELVRRVVATYPQLQADGAEITIEGRLPPVRANEASLSQVVSNLLTNAVKFVAPGTPARVVVRAERDGDDVRVWIEDNGIGIEPRDHERIWTIFTRIGRARDYEGTGIGLAIVRKAVERMGGTLGLESVPGQGSKFWFRLHAG
jgi:PAS domain S-box-containing protein